VPGGESFDCRLSPIIAKTNANQPLVLDCLSRRRSGRAGHRPVWLSAQGARAEHEGGGDLDRRLGSAVPWFQWSHLVLRRETKGLEFLTGYLVEYSLSVDNIFVFILLFSSFRVPPQYQHRVLFWGILSSSFVISNPSIFCHGEMRWQS